MDYAASAAAAAAAAVAAYDNTADADLMQLLPLLVPTMCQVMCTSAQAFALRFNCFWRWCQCQQRDTLQGHLHLRRRLAA
jgi:hypothetical protein